MRVDDGLHPAPSLLFAVLAAATTGDEGIGSSERVRLREDVSLAVHGRRGGGQLVIACAAANPSCINDVALKFDSMFKFP